MRSATERPRRATRALVSTRGAGLILVLLGAAACCADAPEDRAAGVGAKGSAAAAAAPDRQLLRIDAPRTITTRDGTLTVTWVPTGGAVPVNEPFEVDVTVARTDEGGETVAGAEVSMTCFMPDHGHGMLREPRSEELGEGRYRIKGLLLHMGGYWTVSITVLAGGLAATADDEITI